MAYLHAVVGRIIFISVALSSLFQIWLISSDYFGISQILPHKNILLGGNVVVLLASTLYLLRSRRESYTVKFPGKLLPLSIIIICIGIFGIYQSVTDALFVIENRALVLEYPSSLGNLIGFSILPLMALMIGFQMLWDVESSN
ncbi:MAG: hypothetical protein AAF720_13870 [Pseudomonadota bacterium]